MDELYIPIVLLLFWFIGGTERFLVKQNIKAATAIKKPTQAIMIPTIVHLINHLNFVLRNLRVDQ